VRIPGAGRRRFATPSYNQNFNLKLFLLIIVHAVKRMTLQLPGDHRRREWRANKPTCVCERASVLPVSSLASSTLRRVSRAISPRSSEDRSSEPRGFSPLNVESLLFAIWTIDQPIDPSRDRSLAIAFPTRFSHRFRVLDRAARTRVRAASVANLTIERSILGHCTRGLE